MARERGQVVVRQPDEGQSYWQPVPANGYAEVRVSHHDHPAITTFSSGIQVIAPGCYIREHQHPEHDELLFFFEGTGKAVIDGEEYALRPGTTVYVGPLRRHTFINTGDVDLKMCWVLMPGGANGLHDFFRDIGRPRKPGEPAPEPFPRPANVEEIEADTVFRKLDA